MEIFLQDQKCDVGTAADGESAVRCCLQMQPGKDDAGLLLRVVAHGWQSRF